MRENDLDGAIRASALTNYFDNLEKFLTNGIRLGGSLKSAPDTGKNREILVGNLLQHHLPPRVRIIQGGIIIDSFLRSSQQVDIIVCNQFSFVGGAIDYGFIPVEAVIAAIEVKSTIRNEFEKAIGQLADVKTLRKAILKSEYDQRRGLLKHRTLRPLTVAWFWQGTSKIDTIADKLCKMEGDRPNAIYLHGEYLLISDPKLGQKKTSHAGIVNPFLQKFSEKQGVLRGRSYETARGERALYFFSKKDGWIPLQVLLMWFAHEVNRYGFELPDFSRYVQPTNK